MVGVDFQVVQKPDHKEESKSEIIRDKNIIENILKLCQKWSLCENNGNFYCLTTFIDGKVNNKDTDDAVYSILDDGGIEYTNKYATFVSYVYKQTINGSVRVEIKIEKCAGQKDDRYYFEPRNRSSYNFNILENQVKVYEHQYPILEISEDEYLFDYSAMATYLARQKEGLMGSTIMEKA